MLGRYRYVELLLFVGLGGRAPKAERSEVAVFLSGAARAHGFRAALLEARLPVSVGLPGAAELTVSFDPRLDAALGALMSYSDDDLLGAVTGALYPAMIEAYGAHLRICSPVSDAPVRRCLGRVAADLADVQTEGAALVTVGGDGPATFAAEFADLGGPFGPLPNGG
jgi:hypothetical protein